jgi:hypothetical protein
MNGYLSNEFKYYDLEYNIKIMDYLFRRIASNTISCLYSEDIYDGIMFMELLMKSCNKLFGNNKDYQYNSFRRFNKSLWELNKVNKVSSHTLWINKYLNMTSEKMYSMVKNMAGGMSRTSTSHVGHYIEQPSIMVVV